MVFNSFASLLTLALLCIFTFWSIRKGPEAPLPLIVHNFLWGLALLLIASGFVYLKSFSIVSWFTLILALCAFNISAIIVQYKTNQSGRVIEQKQILPEISYEAIFSRLGISILLLMYFVGFLGYLISVGSRFGIETLFTNPTAIRGASGVGYLEGVPLIFRLLLALGPVAFVVLGAKFAQKRPLSIFVRALLMLLIAASMVALLQRTNIFMAGIWLVMTVLSTLSFGQIKRSNRLNNRVSSQNIWKKILAGTSVIIFILLVFQLIASILGKTGEQQIGVSSFSPLLSGSGLLSPFTYFIGGVVGLLSLMDSTNALWPSSTPPGVMMVGDYNPDTHGAATFMQFFKLFPSEKTWDQVAPFIDTGFLTNVYSWYEPIFRDYRIGGVIIFALGAGAISTWLFFNRYKSSLFFWLQTCSLTAIAFSLFTFKLYDTMWLIGLGVVSFSFFISSATTKFRNRIQQN